MSEKKQGNSKSTTKTQGTQLSLPLVEEKKEETATQMSNTQTLDKGKDFEETLAELEKVVSSLEGEVKLEEALKLFDRGMQLSQHCQEFLKNAEQKIEILKRAANGTISTEKFNEQD